MGRLTDPGFELGLWTVNDPLYAENQDNSAPRTGTYHGAVTTLKGFSGASGAGVLTSEVFAASLGETVHVSYYARTRKDPPDLDQWITVEYDPDNGGSWLTSETYRLSSLDSEYELRQFAFTGMGTEARVRFSISQGVTAPGVLFTESLFVDDVNVTGDDVAVKLEERVLDELVSCLQTNLGTELTAIETNRGDSLDLPEPPATHYYKREKLEIAGEKAHVEVFAEDFDFENPYTDINAQRAVAVVPTIIRLTHFNNDGASVDDFELRKMRYRVGLFNVINKNPTLTGTDDAIKAAWVTGLSSATDRDDETGTPVKFQVTVRVDVRIEETQA